MALNFIKHTWQKVVLATVVILIAVVLLLALLINVYWSPILADKVKSAVLKSTDSLYTADFADAKLHILQGKIVLYDINLKPNIAVYNLRKKQGLAPNNLLSIHAKRLVVSHIHPFNLYFKHILNIDQIVLSAPQVRIRYELNQVKDTTNTDHRTLWQKLNKSLKSAHVGQILLNDIQLRYEDHSGKKLQVSEFKEMNIKANDLLIDSATQTDTSRLLYCKDIVTDLHNYKGKSTDGAYTYSVKAVTLSTYTSQLNVQGLAIEPAKNYFDLSRKDRYKINVDSIQLSKFDFLTYHKYRKLSASSLKLHGGTIDVFKNPNKINVYKNKIKSFPSVALYTADADIKIDTVSIKRLNVIYGEFNKKAGKNGAITFNNTHGKILNLTTNKAALQKNNISTIQLNSRFMNSGDFDVFFTFNLTDKAAAYSYKGRLGAMDLRDANPATVPLALAKITSGKLKEFTFDVKGNSKVARGRIQLLYNDLKVKLLKADTANNTLKGKTIISLFANLFVIKHNNPDNPGEMARFANVVYTRPIDFPFFKTAWKTLLAGIKTNMGIDEKAEQAATKMVDKSAVKKQTRLTKKQQRIQRRAERKRQRELKRAQKEAEKKSEKQ